MCIVEKWFARGGSRVRARCVFHLPGGVAVHVGTHWFRIMKANAFRKCDVAAPLNKPQQDALNTQ